MDMQDQQDEIPELETASFASRDSRDSHDEFDLQEHMESGHDAHDSYDHDMREERGHPHIDENDLRGAGEEQRRRSPFNVGLAETPRSRLGPMCGEVFFMLGTITLLALLFVLHTHFVGRHSCLPASPSRPDFLQVQCCRACVCVLQRHHCNTELGSECAGESRGLVDADSHQLETRTATSFVESVSMLWWAQKKKEAMVIRIAPLITKLFVRFFSRSPWLDVRANSRNVAHTTSLPNAFNTLYSYAMSSQQREREELNTYSHHDNQKVNGT